MRRGLACARMGYPIVEYGARSIKRIEQMLNIKSIVKMSKSWEMLEICASRTTAAGVAEVLVLWRPTWEPVDQVSSGAVWDAWMLDCAREKLKEKTTPAAITAAAAGNDNDDDGDEDDRSDVADGERRPPRVKIVTKVVSLATVGKVLDISKKVGETATPKRGRGRPRKNVTGGALTKKK